MQRETLTHRVVGLTLVVGLFVAAIGLATAIVRLANATVEVGDPGTVSRLLVNVFGLQVLGFGLAAVIFLWVRDVHWRSYLRLGEVSDWTLFYGVAVGLSMMLLTVAATGLFELLEIEAAEAQVGATEDPGFYLVLFIVSTFVAVPMEEVFFRGILQRRLEDGFHPAIAIGVASLLFMAIHTGASVGTGGELLALALFFSFGIVLGVSYSITENLFVPVIGHATFNGVQILVRAVEVAL